MRNISQFTFFIFAVNVDSSVCVLCFVYAHLVYFSIAKSHDNDIVAIVP